MEEANMFFFCTVGDHLISIPQQYRLSGNGTSMALVHLHQDEQTALEAAQAVFNHFGGSLFCLRDHLAERNISFAMGDDLFVFDPNRIFTKRGRHQTLTELSRFTKAAEVEIANLASSLLELLGKNQDGPIVAMHNNQGADFSFDSYTQGPFKGDCAVYNSSDTMAPSDFFLTTSPDIFNGLAARDVNVALQVSEPSDDGSLSVYCAQKKIPYVNVEALHGHYGEQLHMMEVLLEVLSTL